MDNYGQLRNSELLCLLRSLFDSLYQKLYLGCSGIALYSDSSRDY